MKKTIFERIYTIAYNIHRSILKGFYWMKKISKKQRAWQITKSQRAMHKLSQRKNKRLCGAPLGKFQSRQIPNNNTFNHSYVVRSPTNLSLINNTEETLLFFCEIFGVISKCAFGDRIYFDLSCIEQITADAVMYIIALVRNVIKTKALRIVCEGNVPRNMKAREMIEKVGFYRFVEANNIEQRNMLDSYNLKVRCGNKTDVEAASRICDFVHDSCGVNHCSTKRLYPMIIELMTNTHDHAYSELSHKMISNWYVYAEDTGDCVHFVFLDTGAGIPSTICKNFAEQIKDMFIRNDAAYIASALRGEFRSSTKQRYRGKGLPEIYNDVKNGISKDFLIISGQGMCIVTTDGIITENINQNDFKGTLFSWNYDKTSIKGAS